MKNKQRSRCMIHSALLYPELATATAPVLSQFTITLCLCHAWPHTAQANMIGRSSIHVISFTPLFEDSLQSSQRSCIHLVSVRHMVPHLKDPDTSIHKMDEGGTRWGIILTPFHSAMKVCHQRMSG